MASFDVVVIGGGSGGIAFAKRAAHLGARVALVERQALGGTCVNRGCVPKKLMWQAANWLHTGRDMAEVGLTEPPRMKFRALKARINAKIDDIRASHASALDDAGVTVFRGQANVYGRDRIDTGGDEICCGQLVLATGARPASLEIEGSEFTETSDDLLAWTDLPDRLVILGGGYIGCEFAAILSGFGVSITLVDPGDALLSPFDTMLGEAAQDSLARAGVEIVLGATPERVRQDGNAYVVSLSSGAEHSAERVLNATGRTPNVDRLGPIGGRLDRAENGALAIGDRLETSLANVHAIGDAADRLPLTPVATRDGGTLADMLFGDGGTLLDLDRVARAAFVIPPVAEIGRPGGAPSRSSRLSDGVVGPDGSEIAWSRIGLDNGVMSGLALSGTHAAELVSLATGLIGQGAGVLDAGEGVHPSFAEELVGR